MNNKTIRGVIQEAAIKQFDAEVLMAALLKKDRSYIYTNPDRRLSESQIIKWQEWLKRVELGEPMAYVLNWKEFYGRRFYVDSRVLIPRSETEEIVDIAIAHSLMKHPELHEGLVLRILELGTGSGAIAVSVAVELKLQQVDYKIKITATDVSVDALRVAEQNARLHGVNGFIEFRLGSLFEPVAGERFDLIIANLPYLPTDEARGNEFEPQLALDGGVDGDEINKIVIEEAPNYLLQGGVLIYEGYGGKVDRKLKNK